MKLVASVLVASAAVLAWATPASAATEEYAVQADLNGDGTADRVVVKAVENNPNEQVLIATVGRTNYVAREELSSPDDSVQPLRVVDLDADGREEVLLTESVGANTLTLSVWGLFDGWRPVKMPDQSRLRIHEGGAEYSFSRFGCDTIAGQRKLVTVNAWTEDWDNGIYSGERTTYSVGFGAVEQWSYTQVTGPRTDPGFQVAAGSCE